MDFYWTSFTRGEGLPGGSGFSEKKGLVAKRYDVMAFRHGFFNMHWWPTPQTAYDGEGHLTKADWSAYDRYFEEILSGRLLGVVPSIWKMPVPEERFYKPKHLSDPKAVATAYWEYSREMARHFYQKGWQVPLKYVYTIDEPGNWYKGSKESIIQIADAIRQGSEDKFRVFIPADTTIGAGHVNFWAIYPSQYHVSKMQAKQKAGDVVWFYQGCHEWQGLPVVYIPDYALAMRLWPWIAWKYDVDGIFHWASNNWGQNPYTENTAADDPRWGPGNGKFFYPGRLLSQIGVPSIEGPVSCIRMKMWRRGMQDYQYFWMLKEKGQDALADSVVNRLVKKALAEGELDWNKELVQGGWCAWEGNWSKKPNDYYGARTELARSLSVLYGGRLKKRSPSVRSKAVTPRPGHQGGAAEAKERPVPRELSQMYRMARSMMSVGQKDAAAAMFRKIVEKYPDEPLAKSAKKYLERLE